MSDDPIPLYDGEPSGATIIPEGGDVSAGTNDPKPGPDAQGQSCRVRGKRRNSRKTCQGVMVCFSPHTPAGRIEHVECPLRNISKGGVEVEFDREVAAGTTACVSYRTISRRCVRACGTVRHCAPIGNGRYKIGMELSRYLDAEELRPAKARPGRDVSPDVRTRKLHPQKAL